MQIHTCTQTYIQQMIQSFNVQRIQIAFQMTRLKVTCFILECLDNTLGLNVSNFQKF